MDTVLDLAKFAADEDQARAFLERLRWPQGPTCPWCEGEAGRTPYKLVPKPGSKTRKGLYKCRTCRRQFTVTVRTIFEDSHIPLGKWLMAIHLLCASKKGMSAHQLHRMLGLTYKSAWFMAHRIRYAMRQRPLVDKLRGTVEVDETYVGGKAENRHTNTVEGYFSLLKRGIIGTYHHVGSRHLWRYCNEFEFRYNARGFSDTVRAAMAVKQAEGKRLTYRPVVNRNIRGLVV